MTCSKHHIWFQNTLDNLHNSVHCLWASFRNIELYHNGQVADVDSFSTYTKGTEGQPQKQWKATARAKMSTSVMPGSELFEPEHEKGFISEIIRRRV